MKRSLQVISASEADLMLSDDEDGVLLNSGDSNDRKDREWHSQKEVFNEYISQTDSKKSETTIPATDTSE